MSKVKGIRDRTPELVEKINEIVSQFRSEVISRGAVERDFSILEQKEVLMEKYINEEKLIFELADQGGQSLAMRYDLTTQWMKYAPNGKSKTFQFGKVYRRDNPSAGRWREFYQFDYDMKGYPQKYGLFECIDLLWQLLKIAKVDAEQIIINDISRSKRLLENYSAEEIKIIFSTLDKFDKVNDWEKILVELKNKEINDVDRIQSLFSQDYVIPQLDELNIPYKVVPTLVRGLSYYTGYVFEVVGVNGLSIAGGGEYGEFIGFSIGIDRIVDISDIQLKPAKMLHLISFGNTEILVLKKAKEFRQKGYIVNVVYISSYKQIKNAVAKIKSGSYCIVEENKVSDIKQKLKQ